MQSVLLFICLCLLICFSAFTIIWRSLLKSAIALAITSIFLTIALFLLGLPLAALFQLSVSAGLVTIILISAISLTDSKQPVEVGKRFSAVPFLLILAGAAIIFVVLFSNLQLELDLTPTASFDQFRDLFWHTRQTDIFGQIIIVLASAFVITVLFKEQKILNADLLEDDSSGSVLPPAGD
jgi:NADH-quinone oxidoreductase subunit J